MPDLAVFAHFDPHGQVAPHVLRHLEALAVAVDRVIVVTTASLTGTARAELTARGELVERPNEGYDFFSWKTGLDHAGAWWESGHVVLANDSVVGPLVGYGRIIATMDDRGASVWGITASEESEPHVQSYVLGFGPTGLRSPLVRAFWLGMTPLASRSAVIAAYELGLSRLLRAAGIPAQAYFVPSPRDDLVARYRRARFAARRTLQEPPGPHAPARGPVADRLQALRAGRPYLQPGAAYNPMIALWDRALDARLPFVKVETLRDDPYQLDPDGEGLLAACEQAHPNAFSGVREYLERTRGDYEQLGRARRKART
jgi:hypothetical protein